MAASPVRLVIFDMAGTTVHDEDFVNVAFRAALSENGIAVTRDEVNAVMGYPKPLAIRRLLERRADAPAAVSDEAVHRLHEAFLHRMNAFYATDPAVREIEGATATFRRLKEAGLRIALDTGFSRSTANVIIHRLGWDAAGLLDATVTSDEVERGRPHPDLALRCMALTGITDPTEVAKVGDTPSDLQEGTAAGCRYVIGVTNGSHTAEELRPYPHTHLVSSITDLPALLLDAPAPST